MYALGFKNEFIVAFLAKYYEPEESVGIDFSWH
jgi:hypothetical protein